MEYTWSSDAKAVHSGPGAARRCLGNRGFEVEWARIGLELVLADQAAPVSWFGQGPHQSYPDTGQGAWTGWSSLSLAEMDVEYVRPQEPGARSGVRSAAAQRRERTFEIHGEPFALPVRSYSQEILDAANRHPDLKPDGKTYLYLDHVLWGVGTPACGPGVLEQYRPEPREADFTLVLTVRLPARCVR